MRFYAGIGSRKTPQHILNIMHHVAAYLAATGNWTLRSGAAAGADTAFEIGAKDNGGKAEIYLPWRSFNSHESKLHPANHPFSDTENAFAKAMHPAWNKCSPSARLLHQRNGRQLFGLKEEKPENNSIPMSEMVICWTENGFWDGGTAQALRMANVLDIPIINLGSAKTTDELEALILKVEAIHLNNA